MGSTTMERRYMVNRKYFWKIAAFVVVVLLLLNPETIPLALFIDAVGIETLLLLLQIQLLGVGAVVFHQLLKPIAVFIAGFASEPMIMPTTKSLKECPWSLGSLLPTAATMMNLLVVGVMVFMLCG